MSIQKEYCINVFRCVNYSGKEDLSIGTYGDGLYDRIDVVAHEIMSDEANYLHTIYYRDGEVKLINLHEEARMFQCEERIADGAGECECGHHEVHAPERDVGYMHPWVDAESGIMPGKEGKPNMPEWLRTLGEPK